MKFVKRSVAVLLTVAAANGAYAQSATKAEAELAAGNLTEARTQIDGAVDKEAAKLIKKGKPVMIKSKTLLTKGNVYAAIALSDDAAFTEMQQAAIDSALSAYNTIKAQEKETSAVYKDAWVSYAPGENATYIQGKNSKVQDLFNGFLNKGVKAYEVEDFGTAFEKFKTASTIITTDTTTTFNAMLMALQMDEPDTAQVIGLAKETLKRGSTSVDAHNVIYQYTIADAQQYENQVQELDIKKRQLTQEKINPLEITLADYKDKADANKAYMKKSKAAADRYNKFSKLAEETQVQLDEAKKEITAVDAEIAAVKAKANKVYATTLEGVEEALADHPSNPTFQQVKIILYMKMDKIDQAIAENKKSIEADPTNPELYFNIGLLYSNQGDALENKEEKAALEQLTIENYNKVLELKPTHYGALVNMGDFYYKKAGNFSGEVEDLIDYTGKAKNAADQAKVNTLKASVIENAEKAKDYFAQAQANQPEGDTNDFEMLINRMNNMIKNNQ